MSGWIKWEKDLETDPRMLRLVRALRERDGCVTGALSERFVVTAACGALLRIWSYADSHIRDDDTLDLGVAEIDELIGVDGFAAAMPDDWLVEVDEHTVELPNFQRHNGSAAKKRAQSAKRAAKYRQRNSNGEFTHERDDRHAPVTQGRHVDQTRPDQKSKTPPVPPRGGTARSSNGKANGKHDPPPDWSNVENLDQDWWQIWLAHRRATRKPALRTTREATALARYPPEVQRAAIEQSMDKGWTGLFPEKIDAAGRRSSPTRSRFDEHTERLRQWLDEQAAMAT